ncbi:LptF/LptG family permease [Amylibacter sp. SFDW26]|uniref:LptF/LptG family permease n=1 Tax=Amylibacter sp. SFDW26 TaxID=2652722 RepID=UPI0012625928|nr:LptF/LptG family permease [Amylibacter sp. SFDW26]KAB7615821.1 LptF/LptG family permease [Amylibacter sp. SFDW26]
MKLIDRYIVKQLIGPFLFFLLIFAGILWLNQALKIVDVVIENGQPGMVFIELSSYLLPRVIESVFPVAAFAAAVFLTNRLYSESEYAALTAAGQTPLQFSRPFIIFGMICFLSVSALAHYITPISNSAFQTRQYEIRQEFLSQLVKEGSFISPKKGVTFYFGKVQEDGLLKDILIRETSKDGNQTIHSAPSGRIVDNDTNAKLVLINGALQRYDPENRLLNVVQFDSLSYDLTQFAKNLGPRKKSAAETITTQLPWWIASAPAAEQSSAIEAQSRLVKALFSLIMPLLGAAVLFSGNFSRAGFFYRITFAILLLFSLNTLRGAAESFVNKTPSLSFTLYSPLALSCFITTLLIVLTIKGWNGFTLADIFKKWRTLK